MTDLVTKHAAHKTLKRLDSELEEVLQATRDAFGERKLRQATSLEIVTLAECGHSLRAIEQMNGWKFEHLWDTRETQALKVPMGFEIQTVVDWVVSLHD